jgi:MFS transporter, DHA1 family, tetracycline resistance protein
VDVTEQTQPDQAFLTNAVEVTEHQRRENLSILAVSAFLRGAHTSAFNVIWQPFVLSLGASMPVVGLLNSLGGTNGIITTLVQPLGGWFADRLGRRPFLIASSLAVIVGYALFAVAGLSQVGIWLAVGIMGLGIAALANPARSSLTAESVRSERHGTAFSLIILATMVPGVILPAVGGWVVDHWGYVSFFPIAILLEAIALGLVWRYLHETRRSNGERLGWGQSSLVLARSIVPPRGLGGFFFAVAADSFCWGMGWGLLYGMLTESLHFSAEQLGLLSSVMSLTWAIFQMPIGRYVDRHSTKKIMIASEALGIPLMLIWLTQTRFEFFVLGQVLFGLTAATWVPVVNTYLTRRVRPEERAEAFGRLYMFRGILAFPAATIGGLLFAWGGMTWPVIGNLAGIFVVIGTLFFIVDDEAKSKFEIRER